MKKTIKNKSMYILSFILPFIIILLMFGLNNAGFGLEKNVLYGDFTIEYYPFLTWLKGALTNNTLTYSFSNGLGDGMFGLITYYILSPFNLLVLLFDKVKLINFAFLIVIIKLSLGSTTMYYYLKNHFKSNDKILLIFASLYALCGYAINFYFNILWFDAFYTFPIVIYGLEKLIKDNKNILYIISLTYIIMTNYYIGYMICIFVCIYLIYYIILNYNFKKDKKEIKKIIIRFIISSLIAGLLSAVIIIPTYFDLKMGYRLNSINKGFNTPSSIFEVLGRLFFTSANNDTILTYTLPNIYTGLITLPLVYIYFRYSNLKEKIVSLLLLIIMCLPFFVPVINLVWHGFNYPYFFNYRYTFMISFLLIIFAYKGYRIIDKVKWQDYLIFVSIFILLCSGLIIKNYQWLSPEIIIINMIFMIIYLTLLFFIKNKKFKNIITVIISVFCLIELLLNGYLIFKTYNFQNNDKYYQTYDSLNEMISEVLPKDNDFYRIEKTFYDKLDDNYIYENYGITTFSSTIKMNVIKFIKNTGIKAGENDLFFTAASSPILNSILNLKYILVIGDIENSAYLKLYDNIDTHTYCDSERCLPVNTYINNHPLSLGFMVNENVKNYIDKEIKSYDYQKEIFNNMIGKESESIIKIENLEENKYNIPDDDKVYYMYIKIKNGDRNDSGYLIINNSIFSDLSAFTPSIYILPQKYKGQTIEVNIEKIKGDFELDKVEIYSFDRNVFEEEISVLENNLMTIEEFNESYIKGKINVDKNKTFFSSIPYDDGWKVFVDGKKVETYKLFDTFIGFDLEEGEHIIEFKYSVVGLKYGVIISILGLISMTIYTKFNKKQ